jgi:hypothetical protein
MTSTLGEKMVYDEHGMTKEEVAKNIEWMLADPATRIFSASHHQFVIDILNWSLIHLSSASAARVRAETYRREGVRTYEALKEVSKLLAANGWVPPKQKAVERLKGEDFDRYTPDPPHCLMSAAQNCGVSDPANLVAYALGFPGFREMCAWEDYQTQNRILLLLNNAIKRYEVS